MKRHMIPSGRARVLLRWCDPVRDRPATRGVRARPRRRHRPPPPRRLGASVALTPLRHVAGPGRSCAESVLAGPMGGGGGLACGLEPVRINSSGGLFFLRPAKTGTNSLKLKLKTAENCSARVCEGGHATVRPPDGFDGALVLRSPLERFVSAFHETHSAAAAGSSASCDYSKRFSNGTSYLSCETWPSDDKRWATTDPRFWATCSRIGLTTPTAGRLQRLVGSGSPLGFARWLRHNAADRAAWLSAPAPPSLFLLNQSGRPIVTSTANASCMRSCGRLCGFVPQVFYQRNARYTACLSRFDGDVQRILDVAKTGCRTPNVGAVHVSADHSDGTHGAAAESAELASHVMALYTPDWQLWERQCLKIFKTALLTTLYLRWSYAARSVVEGFI